MEVKGLLREALPDHDSASRIVGLDHMSCAWRQGFRITADLSSANKALNVTHGIVDIVIGDIAHFHVLDRPTFSTANGDMHRDFDKDSRVPDVATAEGVSWP